MSVDHYGLELDKLWPKFLRKWLVATAAQAVQEDATNHTCLVLMGGQGKGKTTWLNNLCPPELQHLRYTGHIEVRNKESKNLLAEKFLVNIDDQLDLINDLRYLKSMFTLDKVNNRKAFDKYSPNRSRICSFVASVNSSEFLTDDQNRRYLVFHVQDIALDQLKNINHPQLWAQIKYLMEAGFKYWFEKAENDQISDINDAFRVKPEEEETLMQFLAPDPDGEPMMQTEILYFLQTQISSKLNSRKLSTALKKRGFPRKSVRTQKGKGARYVYLVKKLEDIDRIKDKKNIKNELFGDERLEKFGNS